MEKIKLTVQLNVLIDVPEFVTLAPVLNKDYHLMYFFYCKNPKARTGGTNIVVDRRCRQFWQCQT